MNSFLFVPLFLSLKLAITSLKFILKVCCLFFEVTADWLREAQIFGGDLFEFQFNFL
jgi:hypothetical protein